MNYPRISVRELLRNFGGATANLPIIITKWGQDFAVVTPVEERDSTIKDHEKRIQELEEALDAAGRAGY